MQRRALVLGLSAVGCGPRPIASPPAAPGITSATELIPSDLDVVLRLDLSRVKAALGVATLTTLAQQILAHDRGNPEPDELVIESLLAAEQVYLAYRPSPSWTPLDRVLTLQGHFEQLRRPPIGFVGGTDLGRDLRYWDRQSAPSSRGGVARVYAWGDRVRAFVSEAELDAVERTLNGLGSAPRLEPPDDGTFSLAARPALLERLVGHGTLRELVEGAKALRAVAELESDGARLKLELLLSRAEPAQQLAQAGKLALSRALGDAVVDFTLTAESDRVVLSARLTRAQLAPLLLCVWGTPGSGSAAACPW